MERPEINHLAIAGQEQVWPAASAAAASHAAAGDRACAGANQMLTCGAIL